MDAIGPETPGEAALLADAKRFRVVSIIAGIVSLPFALVHLAFAAFAIPSFEGIFTSMGGQLPLLTRLLISASHNGVLVVLVLIVDVAVFVGMYRLAKRYWIGLLFAPVFIYLAITSTLVPVLYLPLFNVVSLVK